MERLIIVTLAIALVASHPRRPAPERRGMSSRRTAAASGRRTSPEGGVAFLFTLPIVGTPPAPVPADA